MIILTPQEAKENYGHGKKGDKWVNETEKKDPYFLRQETFQICKSLFKRNTSIPYTMLVWVEIKTLPENKNFHSSLLEMAQVEFGQRLETWANHPNSLRNL